MNLDIEQRRLRCEDSGVEHVVQIALPFRFEAMEAPPLVVALDGLWTFGTLVDDCRVMSMGGAAPEAVVVGVSFGADRMSDYLAERARWYTPTPYVPPALTGVKHVTEDETGRGAVFRGFLARQLLPLLDAEFGVGERWFFGHSFGGLFGLSALFSEPELFDKWVLASPSIWWDNRAILGAEEAYAAENDDLAAAVFLSAGGAERAVEAEPGVVLRMIDDVERLAATLRSRSYPSLRLEHAVLDGETHESTIGAAASRGLRVLV